MVKARQALLVVALGLLAIAALRDVARLGDQLPWRLMGDFPDFYCAGLALDEARSPYAYEPLHACEHRVAATGLLGQNPSLVVPAPQPPYDFPPFMLLARLPFPVASAIFALAIALAMLACAAAFTRLGVAFDLALLAFAIPAAYQEMAAGQIVPFALLALVLCATALAARRDGIAGVLAALTAIEPQFGVPVALSVLIYAPRARWSLAATAAAMAIAGAWTVTPGGFVEYLRRTLPAHAASELDWPFQYSLSYAVHYVGVPAGIARTLGGLSFLILLAVGLWLAPKLVRRLGRREMLAFFPAACAVVGGVFIHAVEMPAAIPTALIFAADLRGRQRAAGAAALCLLMVPWIKVWAIKKLFAASVLLCALVLVRLGVEPLAAIGTLCIVAAVAYAFELAPPPAPPPVLPRVYPAGYLASEAWARFAAAFSARGPAWFAIKIPTWSALTALLCVAFSLVRQRPPCE